MPPVIEYVPASSPAVLLSEPVKISNAYNDPDVIVYDNTGSVSPNTFDWPAVGVMVIDLVTTVGLKEAVEFEYAVEDVGTNVADNCADPRPSGTQSQNPVVDATTTAEHPSMETPPSVKFTVPARDVVAVMRSVVR